MAQRPKSILENILYFTSKFPWWAGVLLAASSFLFLHWYAGKEFPVVTETHGPYEKFLPGFLHSLAFFGQLIAPVVFLSGALISAIVNLKRKNLYDRICLSPSEHALDNLSWRDFEYLVGEYFRRRQFNVEETKVGADGGADLIASKGGEKLLIQCQHYKTKKVEEKAIQELHGVMVDARATGGIIATSGQFTHDATAFARANNIVLLNGREMLSNMRANVDFQGPPGRKPQKMIWASAGLILVILCCSALLLSEIGMSLRSTLSTRILEFIPFTPKPQKAKSDTKTDPSKHADRRELAFTPQQLRSAIEEVLKEKKRQQPTTSNKEAHQQRVEENYLYEIELITGGRVYVDNIEVFKDKLTYTDRSGVIVSINIEEVKTLKRVKGDG